MTLVIRVCHLVAEHNEATADDLYPLLANEGFTRKQVIRALQNGRNKKYLLCDGPVGRQGTPKGGMACGTYRPNPAQQLPRNRMLHRVSSNATPKPFSNLAIPRVNSVWALGQSLST